MNLDQFHINWFLLILTVFAFYTARSSFKSKKDNGSWYILDKALSITLTPIFAILLIWLTYHVNYINAGYDSVAKVTLHSCEQGKCEYVGIVTYRPYMRELMIITTPLYPILNCPSDSCVQEQIFVDKGNVKSLEKL